MGKGKIMKKIETVGIILTSIMVLMMSYGFIPGSFLLVSILTFGTLAVSIARIYVMDRSKLEKELNSDKGFVGRFMKEGPIQGPLRLILFILMFITFITGNMFAWQVYLIAYLIMIISVYSITKEKGINID
jgi:hypothetical protein